MNDTRYKVVFQLSDNDTFVQKSLIRQLSNLMETLEPVVIEVVAHSYGVDLLLKDCTFKSHVQALRDEGVNFIVCEKTLEREKLDTTAFIPNIATVAGGLAHIVKRQTEGWSYIKAGI